MGATFVTLTQRGQLRGCIGSLEAWRPLLADVQENACNAAFRDPRFEPLRADELPVTRVEVSLLTPAEPLTFTRRSRCPRPAAPGHRRRDLHRRPPPFDVSAASLGAIARAGRIHGASETESRTPGQITGARTSDCNATPSQNGRSPHHERHRKPSTPAAGGTPCPTAACNATSARATASCTKASAAPASCARWSMAPCN